MAVRFLPSSEEQPEPAPEREGFAEVIELRSLLARFASGGEPLVSSPDAGPGTDTDPDAAGEIGADADPDAHADGVRLLARRALSSGELRSLLLAKDHPQNQVEEVIVEFERSLYLDDSGLARSLTEKLRESKRASRAQIRVKLRERKIPDAVIETVLAELDEGEEERLLRDAAEDRARRLAGLDRQTAERRLLGYLARRGWSGEPVYRVVREVLAG